MITCRIRMQCNKIDSMVDIMVRRDKEFSAKCVAAREAGNIPQANSYAEERDELRKMAKTALLSWLTLSQIEMMVDEGYRVPRIKSMLAEAGHQIQPILPDVSFELGEINESLEGLMDYSYDIS